MAARSLKLEDMLREAKTMRVELTKREIELLLLMINDAASGDFSLGDDPIFSNEELLIVKKLGEALEKSTKTESLDDLHPGHVSQEKH